MRGKLHWRGWGVPVQRNIPAHAGKTMGPCGCGVKTEEHPRACGENSWSSSLNLMTPGTSPRMRGKRGPFVYALPKPRNIPAHAGKTDVKQITTVRHAEHPRACGENVAFCVWHVCVRNIPAHAGKTQRHQMGMGKHQEHPRACGENHSTSACSWAIFGTSPRMRGKQHHQACLGRHSGNIPAHAGKTRGGGHRCFDR